MGEACSDESRGVLKPGAARAVTVCVERFPDETLKVSAQRFSRLRSRLIVIASAPVAVGLGWLLIGAGVLGGSALGLAVIGGIGGCARVETVQPASTAPIEPAVEAFDAVPTVQLISPWGSAGSAVRLDERRFLTARHVLPRRGNQLELRGQTVEFVRLAAGEGSGTVNDWALIRIDRAPSVLDKGKAFVPPEVRSIGRMRERARMYFVGYWRGQSPWLSRAKVRALETSVFPGSVVAIADSPSFPSREFVYLRTEAGDVFPGASGGPALIWDRDTKRLVVVGIYVGAGEYTHTFGGEGGKVQIIRKLPEAAMDAWRRDRGEAVPEASEPGKPGTR